VHRMLHLKSAVTAVSDDTLLVNPDWIDDHFDGYRTISVDPSEPLAANVLRVGGRVAVSTSYPRTAEPSTTPESSIVRSHLQSWPRPKAL
jgi:dimethylargininase